MNSERHITEPDATGPTSQNRAPVRKSRVLEPIAAGVLIAVLAALAWMIVAANLPAATRAAVPAWQIVTVTILLVIALLLVSAVALLHTRK